MTQSPDSRGDDSTVTAVILAGDRGPKEALPRAAGVCCKALVPVAGQAMLIRVLSALSNSRRVGEQVIAGLPEAALATAPELQAILENEKLRQTPLAPGPSASAAAALTTIATNQAVLLTTADHALLRPQVVDDFLARALTSGLDFAACVIRYPGFRAAYPDMPKTVLRFSDGHYCGCNLFAILTPAGRDVITAWRRVEKQRKTPWKTVSMLGWASVLQFLIGRLSITTATERLSRRLGVNLGVVESPFPDAAIDVDSEADWRFVEKLVGDNATC